MADSALKERLKHLQNVQRWCLESEATPRINAMLESARSEPGIPVLHEELDRDPWLLNCVNGTLELKTGELREHRREDYLTKLCPTPYQPEAACPAWQHFLDGMFQKKAAVITFLQRLLGMCLTGDVSEHVLPIFHGRGANGKTTLINAVLNALGDEYAIKIRTDVLMQPKGERHPTEIADLFGRRLVVASETPQGERLNEAPVKDLTGGERLHADA